MPLYNYKCVADDCGNVWEELVLPRAKRGEDQNLDPIVCPVCGTPHARRLFSGGSTFILKGGGWAADGYASVGNKKSHD